MVWLILGLPKHRFGLAGGPAEIQMATCNSSFINMARLPTHTPEAVTPRKKPLTIPKHGTMIHTMSKAQRFTFTQLQTVTSLGRGEIRECITRRIISAPPEVGQGHHRSYSKWNLVEGVIAAGMLRQIRAGAVEQIMKNLRSMLDYHKIDPNRYCEAPGRYIYEVIFPSRKEPTERADLLSSQEMGEGAHLLGAATQEPHHGPLLTFGTPLAAFCTLVIDLAQAVRFVNHLIEARL